MHAKARHCILIMHDQACVFCLQRQRITNGNRRTSFHVQVSNSALPSIWISLVYLAPKARRHRYQMLLARLSCQPTAHRGWHPGQIYFTHGIVTAYSLLCYHSVQIQLFIRTSPCIYYVHCLFPLTFVCSWLSAHHRTRTILLNYSSNSCCNSLLSFPLLHIFATLVNCIIQQRII